jgi:glycosyltransferase involved in cell wall biosynthesis
MKIAILGIKGIPGHHGVEVVVDSLIPHLVSMGHSVTVYGYDSYTTSIDENNGVRIKTVAGSTRKHTEMISHMLRASIDTRNEDYDIVHIHNTDPCLLAWIPKAKYGIIATSHGQAYLRNKWSFTAKFMSKIAERFFIRIPDIATSVSKPLAGYYTIKYNKKTVYIPNGITIRERPSKTFLDKWNLNAQQFLFCSAGRIEKTKGLHTLLKAYSILKPEIPLVIAGGGSGTDFAYYRKLKMDKPMDVKFVGFLGGEEFYALYAYAKAFIFPSEYEAMSIALLEALSFGVPTIYSDIPENRAVADGIAYPFTVGDEKSLSEQLQYVLSNPGDAKKLAKKAETYIRANHNWKAIAAKYNDLYIQLQNLP